MWPWKTSQAPKAQTTSRPNCVSRFTSGPKNDQIVVDPVVGVQDVVVALAEPLDLAAAPGRTP